MTEATKQQQAIYHSIISTFQYHSIFPQSQECTAETDIFNNQENTKIDYLSNKKRTIIYVKAKLKLPDIHHQRECTKSNSMLLK